MYIDVHRWECRMKGNIHRKQNSGIQATLLYGEFGTKTKQWAKRYLNKRYRKKGSYGTD